MDLGTNAFTVDSVDLATPRRCFCFFGHIPFTSFYRISVLLCLCQTAFALIQNAPRKSRK